MFVTDVAYILLSALLVVVVAAAATAAGLRGGVERCRRKGQNVPPGSMGWPFIGETLAFMKPHPVNSHGDFMEERIRRYGKIFTSHLMGAPAVVSVDPELNQFVLRNDDKLFEPNWPQSMLDIVGRDSLLANSGDAHRNMKSLPGTFFATARLRGQMFSDTNNYVIKALSAWKEGTAIFFEEEAYKLTFNLLLKNILSLTPGDPESENLRNLYMCLNKGMASFIHLNIPGTAYRKALQSSYTIRKAMKKLMEERLHKKKEGTDTIGEGDFLGYVLEQSRLNFEQSSYLLLGLLQAGYKTSTPAICLAVYYLMDCPKAVEQLREEHINIVSAKKQRGEDAALTWEDYRKMEFTYSVIREILRLGNVARMVFRKASTDIHFKGYDIPRGWGVILTISAGHMDPSMYQNPLTFDPWRWQTDPTSTTGMDNYIAFGRGVRNCIGREFSNMVMSVFLHHLILNYNWEPMEPDHPFAFVDAEFPKGLPIKVHKLDFFC